MGCGGRRAVIRAKPRRVRYASFVGLAWPRQLRRLSQLARFKILKRLKFKPRLTEIEDIPKAKHNLNSSDPAEA